MQRHEKGRSEQQHGIRPIHYAFGGSLPALILTDFHSAPCGASTHLRGAVGFFQVRLDGAAVELGAAGDLFIGAVAVVEQLAVAGEEGVRIN
jgi:hypothetical protein